MMHHKNAETIFEAALQLDSEAKRKAYLDLACGDNTGLRRKMDDMLEAHGRADAFFADAGN